MSATYDEFEPSRQYIAQGEERDDAVYPELYNISARFMFRFLPRPAQTSVPEFLYIPESKLSSDASGEGRLAMRDLIAQWNLAWEAAQLRQEMFADELSRYAPKVRLPDDVNVHLLLTTGQRLAAYLPLYMLLPRDVADRFGIPLLRRMIWPYSTFNYRIEELMPADLVRRLSAAFSSVVWPDLVSGSPKRAFNKDDSLIMLSHNLDFWLPHAVTVVQDRLRSMDFVEFEDADEPAALENVRRNVPDDISVDRCRMGGHIWMGRDEAHDALKEVVATADRDGNLSAIIDAIRSNRVEEDFSDHWSFAREDFERKLYKKRSKVQVRFVELEKAEVVVGPYSDISENLLWQDFIAVLNPKERQIVICFSRGTTKLTEIATELGYANHSPVSKALARIRRKALKFLQ